jgi:hypothetical protein
MRHVPRGVGMVFKLSREADNAASIALAQSVGLTRVLAIVHYAHAC